MNVNTVRLPIDPGFEPWNAPAALLMLDALYESNMMAVITVDDGINSIGRVREAVTFFRSHPAVLAFSLGSEPNLNLYFGAASSISDVVVRTENAAKLVKSLTTHPVVVSWGDVDVDRDGLRLVDTQRYVNTDIPSADIWMLNVFRGSTFGRLWEQWSGISSKPILLGEWGTDSFRTTSTTLPITGVVDQQMQADWDGGLWNDILRNASARNPASVAIGGFALEFVDALWKVPPFSSQQSNGFASGGHPDAYSNEEYYGIVSSNRTPKAAYEALATVFAPSYFPPPATMAISARSSGAAVSGTALGLAQFWVDGQLLYSKSGGAGGGRGINVAAFSTGTGNVVSIQNFDTWGTRGTGTAFTAIFQYLDSLPAGTVVAVAVGDDAGLNRDNSCERWPFAWTEELLQRFETMGSTRIRSYCFRNSWSFVAVKSEGRARGEHLAAGIQTTTDVVIAE